MTQLYWFLCGCLAGYVISGAITYLARRNRERLHAAIGIGGNPHRHNLDGSRTYLGDGTPVTMTYIDEKLSSLAPYKVEPSSSLNIAGQPAHEDPQGHVVLDSASKKVKHSRRSRLKKAKVKL